MKRHELVRWTGLAMVLALAGAAPALAQNAAPAPKPAAAQPAEPAPPQVKPAGPGVFTATKVNPTRFHLVVAGHAFTSREGIEKYLAWRAASLTMEQGYGWFSLVEHRGKGDKVPASKPDPQGPRFSFRMGYFRPAWRYKTGAAPEWKNWSPFSGAAFPADTDPKSVTSFEVSADIVLHKGQVADDDPLAFDGSALSDFLINQVEPPQ